MRNSLIGFATLLIISSVAAGQAADNDQMPHSEQIDVARYLLDIRVVDAGGRAVTDLRPEDFNVNVGDQEAIIEAADWMEVETSNDEEQQIGNDDGRLVVFLVQTDFARNRERVLGQMAFVNNFVGPILGMLRPEDQAAVLSFDSQLRVQSDFGADREATERALSLSLRLGEGAFPGRRSGDPSLVSHLDREEMRQAARGEEALLLVAEALHHVEGKKIMILVGWGFGDVIWSAGGSRAHVSLSGEWNKAVARLRHDKTPVISIGTGAGQLTYGIAATARSTGGLHTQALGFFPTQSLAQIEGALTGHYEVVLRLTRPLPPGEHRLEVTVGDRRFRVHSPATVIVEQEDLLYKKVVALLNAGETALGVDLLRESLTEVTWPAEVATTRARAMVEAAQWEAALVICDQLETQGLLDDELVDLQTAARTGLRRANDAKAISALAEARRSLLEGEASDARDLLDESIRLAPALSDAWFERGMMSLGDGDLEKATTDLKRYLILAPQGRYASEVREVLGSLSALHEEIP